MVASSLPEQSALPLRRALQGAGLLTFVALGLPDGLLGVAWPEIRREQGQPASALSVLLLCSTAAFFVSTSISATLARRFGNRQLLMAATVLAAGGAVLVATSQHFTVTALGLAVMTGGAGLVDAIISSLVSIVGPQRMLSVMHSIYAVGAAGAPVVIAAFAGSAWRFVYLTIAAIHVVLLVCWYRYAQDGPRPGRRPRLKLRSESGEHLSIGAVAVALLTFVTATGLEIAVAAWAAVYVADGLHQRPGIASLGAVAFWVALCLGRLLAGGGGVNRARSWLIGGSIASVGGGALLWALPNTPAAIAAFAILGAGAGPMLPLLTVLTPLRVGRSAAAQLIGWQLAASSVGAAALAGGIGVWVHHSGVGAIPPAIMVIAIACTVLIVALDRQPRVAD